MAHKKAPFKRQSKKNTNGFGKINQEAAHNVYRSPFNKKPFAISQLELTDNELVSRRRRRLQMEFFESAQLHLRYSGSVSCDGK